MKRKVFINGIGAVTPQGVWRSGFFSEAEELDRAITAAKQPSYKEIISAGAIRRMSRGIKMGIYAAQQALAEASVTLPGAIVTGTGLGCSEDSDKFLRSLWENEEQFLTPTSFIQSTHNTVAAQIALQLSCKGHNVTYVNGNVSFETALLDSLLLLQSGEEEMVLLGAVDEIAEQTYGFLQAAGYIKDDARRESVKNSDSPGVNYSEGAYFFSMGACKTLSSYAAVIDVTFINELNITETTSFLSDFLDANGVDVMDIDAVLLGYNGDTSDDLYYSAMQQLIPLATPLYYKHLSGQFDTASGFGLMTAAYLLKCQSVPSILHWSEPIETKERWNHILLYNQCRGRDHSLTLITTC